MFCRKSSNLIRRALIPHAAMVIVFCGLFMNTAAAQEPDPRDILKRMGDAIASLDSYSLSGDAYADARLDAGLIIEHASQATLQVRKPDTVRITNTTSEDHKELFFGSGVLTVYTRSMNFYGQTEIPEGVEKALDYAVDEIGIDAPMLDFVSGEVAERLLVDATDVQYVGTSLIRGDIYDHVVIRTDEIDIQLWIATEGQPLPGKMALSAKWDGGAPRTVVFMSWDTDPDIPEGSLVFDPPEGATKINFGSRSDTEEQ
jgi:hypothetical protein